MNSFWLALGLALVALPLHAGSRDQALKMYNRIVGVPPDEATLKQMSDLIDQGKAIDAAKIAVDQENFLRLTVKQLATSWTNVDHSIDKPFNDFSATVVGFVNNDLDFSKILSDDILFTGADGLAGVAAYARNNNTHFENFAAGNFSYKTQLVQRTQSTLAPLPAAGSAYASGLLTTREFGLNFYSAGTNRRAFESVMNNFLCRKMEQVHDATRPDTYVRRDVDRNPGGNPVEYKNKCAGCHAGMDPLANAFAHIDFINIVDTTPRSGNIFYDEAVIPGKITRGADVFPSGYTPTNDDWINLWVEGPNAGMGFKGSSTGSGIKSFGEMITKSTRFEECMAETVFQRICLHPAASNAERNTIKNMATKFAGSGYKMKVLFMDAGVACKGD